jgi:hypothetical protein
MPVKDAVSGRVRCVLTSRIHHNKVDISGCTAQGAACVDVPGWALAGHGLGQVAMIRWPFSSGSCDCQAEIQVGILICVF